MILVHPGSLEIIRYAKNAVASFQLGVNPHGKEFLKMKTIYAVACADDNGAVDFNRHLDEMSFPGFNPAFSANGQGGQGRDIQFRVHRYFYHWTGKRFGAVTPDLPG